MIMLAVGNVSWDLLGGHVIAAIVVVVAPSKCLQSSPREVIYCPAAARLSPRTVQLVRQRHFVTLGACRC